MLVGTIPFRLGILELLGDIVKIAPVVFGAMLVAFAVACLCYPRTVQSFAIKSTESGITSRSECLQRFIRSDKYILNVRMVGAIALIMATCLIVSAFRGK